jgi:hypothetical protein
VGAAAAAAAAAAVNRNLSFYMFFCEKRFFIIFSTMICNKAV